MDKEYLPLWVRLLAWIVITIVVGAISGCLSYLLYSWDYPLWFVFIVFGVLIILVSGIEVVVLDCPLSRRGSFIGK